MQISASDVMAQRMCSATEEKKNNPSEREGERTGKTWHWKNKWSDHQGN